MGIITISRQIGAGEAVVAKSVADKLGWECVDKQILNKEVEDTGINLPYIVHFDERVPQKDEEPPNLKDHEIYIKALQKIIREFADKGDVVIVGRGANFILKDYDALHFRLIADLPYRIQRVMETRWVNEGPARYIIEQNDKDRASFIRRYFHADWEDPVHYHAVLNTSKLGLETVVERIVSAAKSRWNL
jgi:cytidylate kinase